MQGRLGFGSQNKVGRWSALVVSIATALILWSVLSMTFQNHRYSWFWKPNLTRLDEVHAERVAESRASLRALAEPQARRTRVDRTSEICVVMTASPRLSDEVIIQSINGLLNRQGNASVPLNIVQAFEAKIDALDGEFKTLFKVAPTIIPDKLKAPLKESSDINNNRREGPNYYLKHRASYITALTLCAESSDFVLVVEDDVYPVQDYLDKTLDEVITILVASLKTTRLGYVKLYFGHLGWEVTRLTDLFLFGLFLLPSATIITGILSYVFNLRNSRPLTLFIFLFWLVFISIVFVAIDKCNVVPQFPGLQTFDDSCCSLAHLYTKRGAKNLAEFLESNQDYRVPVDLLMDMWVAHEKRYSYVYQPHLFQHIGIYSSRPGGSNRGYADLIISTNFPEDLFDGEFFP